MIVEQIVGDYIRVHRPHARSEMRVFEDQPTLIDAIRDAALCRLKGKRHPHQRRLRQDVLEEAERKLQCAVGRLVSAKNFGALHAIVVDEIGSVRGIGELAVYDIAHRIGAKLGSQPELVYLHRGTRAGAATLGFSGKTVDPRLLPATFSRLTAAEIEDCLCIYKNELTGLAKPPSGCTRTRVSVARRCGEPRPACRT